MQLKLSKLFIVVSFVMMIVACKPQEGVKIHKKGDGFELRVNGVPTYIKGVGGANRLDIASANGANAFRTWSGNVKSVERTLEQARQNNMYVMQGIGLPKNEAMYSNEEFKEKTRAQVLELATSFKDDPNILVWGIGNEVELDGANSAEVWGFIEELSLLIKSVDSRHLTSTVISHNAKALNSIAKYCPSLDMVGINSYGSIFDVKEMVAVSDYNGPYMITEWGPTGWWETTNTTWGAPIEQTSEEKRIVYEERYNRAILGDSRCLGSFVFLWGQKEERTPTWFCMFVESKVEGLPLKGEKTPMVEAMQRVWTGVEPDQTAPVVKGIKVNGLSPVDSPIVNINKEFTVKVEANDRENDKMSYIWEILYEATKTATGGAYEPRPERYGEIIVSEDPTIQIKINEKGNYRIYVYISDGTGFISTANCPIKVE